MSGLQVIDILNPQSPNIVGSYSSGIENAYGVFISGTNAYLSAYHDFLQIVNVSNPSNPTLTGIATYPVANEAHTWKAFISGNYAYVEGSQDSRMILNISDPTNTFVEEAYNL